MTLLKRGITRIVPLAVIILGRDVLLSLSAFYIRYTSLPPPVRAIRCFFDLTNSTTHGILENLGTILGLLITFSGGSADNNQQGEVAHSFAKKWLTVSQYNTALQLLLMGVTTISPLIPYDMQLGLQALQCVIYVFSTRTLTDP